MSPKWKSWFRVMPAGEDNVAAAAVLMVGIAVRGQTEWRAFVETPSGRSAVFSSDAYDEFQWLLRRTRPFDFLFDCDGGECFLLGLRNPAKVPFLTRSDFTRPEQVRELVESLEKQRVRFVWCQPDREDLPGARLPPSGDHLGPFLAYLRSHYHVAKSFPNFDQLWERNPEPHQEAPQKRSIH